MAGTTTRNKGNTVGLVVSAANHLNVRVTIKTLDFGSIRAEQKSVKGLGDETFFAVHELRHGRFALLLLPTPRMHSINLQCKWGPAVLVGLQRAQH